MEFAMINIIKLYLTLTNMNRHCRRMFYHAVVIKERFLVSREVILKETHKVDPVPSKYSTHRWLTIDRQSMHDSSVQRGGPLFYEPHILSSSPLSKYQWTGH